MNAPTLLVGLGGIGGQIIDRVAQMVQEDDLKDIAFLVIDTDANDLGKLEKSNPLLNLVQTSSRETVGEYLNRDEHAREEWFPVNPILNNKIISEGAGQIRSISRLAADTLLRTGDIEQLNDAIASLFQVDQNELNQALRVLIISSLAGGTGSGLIVPIATYIRHYLKQHFTKNSNIIRGFFILPEVFYTAIKGQPERNNLKTNAYATLRELDAFLMKGDNMLPERYADSVKIEFPRISSVRGGFEEYEGRPYDFCFLFDAQNADGDKLNSLNSYLDHAANVIYSLSIGPMNRRSNSSEDNVIRSLIREGGRNRYAGAGASRLIYPYKDIKNFIALNWTNTCISDQWLEYDKRYIEQRKEQEAQNQNRRKKPVEFKDFYIQNVEAEKDRHIEFAEMIYEGSQLSDESEETNNKWEKYINSVEDYSNDTLTGNRPSNFQRIVDSIITNLDDISSDATPDYAKYAQVFYDLGKYTNLARQHGEDYAPIIASTVFRPAPDMSNLPNYQLERFLFDDQNQFLHPNAVRYLLYKMHDAFSQKVKDINTTILDLESQLEAFKNHNFNPNGSNEEDGSIDNLSRFDKKGRFRKGNSQVLEEALDTLNEYKRKVEEFEKQSALLKVMEAGAKFINNLTEAYATMYNRFSSKISTLDDRISSIKDRYSNQKGSTTLYVCADKKYLDEIFKNKPNMEGAMQIGSELSELIFKSALDYAQEYEKEKNKGEDDPEELAYLAGVFDDLFDRKIVGYYEGIVEKNYGPELDLNILEAIDREAELEAQINRSEISSSVSDAYFSKRIKDARKLSVPFIEHPLGEVYNPIYSCAYNPEIVPDKGDHSQRAELIRQKLVDRGGEADEVVPKNELIFYQSFYGMRANDLGKFAPPKNELTYQRDGGEYYKAYYDLTTEIHPNPLKSKEINPHISRWWHIVTKMPDLDEENQKAQEKEIYAAYFWTLINQYVEKGIGKTGREVYMLYDSKLGFHEDELYISSGGECRDISQVLDAIAIYPKLTHFILEKVKEETDKDVTARNLKNGILLRGLENYSLPQPKMGDGDEAVESRSVFDLPFLLQKIMTPQDFDEEVMKELIIVEIEQIYNYLSQLVPRKELAAEMGKVLSDQLNKHLISLEKEHEANPKLYKEPLFHKTSGVILAAFRDMDLDDLYRQYDRKITGLKES